MTDQQASGLALISGSAAGIITMSLHPTGHDLFGPGRFAAVAHMAIAIHGLALASLPVLFFGAVGLSRRLGSSRLSLAGLIAYGFAVVATMNAAVASGLIAPVIGREILETAPPVVDVWKLFFHYNGAVNQAFAAVYVLAASAALVLWSSVILRTGVISRGVAIYGCILGPLTVFGMLVGHLRLDVHGFGMIIFSQAIWFITVGLLLMKGERPASS
jgi:hypothetical protein